MTPGPASAPGVFASQEQDIPFLAQSPPPRPTVSGFGRPLMLEVLLCPGSSHTPCHPKDRLNKIFSQCWKLLCVTRKIPALNQYVTVPFPLHWLVPVELQTKQVQMKHRLVKPPGAACKCSSASLRTSWGRRWRTPWRRWMAITWVEDTALQGAADAVKGRAATWGDPERTHAASCAWDGLKPCRVPAGTCSSCDDTVFTPKLCGFH